MIPEWPELPEPYEFLDLGPGASIQLTITRYELGVASSIRRLCRQDIFACTCNKMDLPKAAQGGNAYLCSDSSPKSVGQRAGRNGGSTVLGHQF